MTQDKITITQSEYDHRLRMSYEDGYQKGMYDGIIEAATNAAPQKRVVAIGNQDGLTAVDPLVYDHNIYYFLQGTGRR